MAFALVCVVYIGILLNITVISRSRYVDLSVSDGSLTYTKPIRAQRGGIYDRNGVPLVTNRSRYDLAFYYSQMNPDPKASNEWILESLNALEEFGLAECRATDYFPLEGEYPDVSYTEEAKDEDSVAYARLKRVIRYDELDEDESAEDLARFLARRYSVSEKDYSPQDIMRILRVRFDMEALQFSDVQPYYLAYDIGEEGVARIAEQGIRGLHVETTGERIYHYPGYASHILGRIGAISADNWSEYKKKGYAMSDKVGLSGCEYAFEEYLHGFDGIQRVTEDRDGNVIKEETVSEPVPGKDVYLTIDIRLQIAAENALPQNASLIHGWTGTDECDAGSVVAIQPDTFDILALASYPTYNLESFNLDYEAILASETSPLTNRATYGLYAPGSTFKIGMAVAAIMEQSVTGITGTTKLNCEGKYTKYDDYQPECWVYSSLTSPIHEHGWIDATEALEVSCNCFFYEAGDRLGISKMNEYCRRYGLGSETGIELGEAVGTLAGPDCTTASGERVLNWYPGDTLSAAIGQSYNQFTPLQMACYVSTVVNGGTRYSAHLLASAQTYRSDDPYYVTIPEPVSKIEISEEALHVVREGMRAVTTSSSTVSYLMANVPVAVGSKTGTAQKTGYADYAMFVCVAPYDAPEIVISVCMEKGSSGGYSAYTAARILETYYKNEEVPESGTSNPNAITKDSKPAQSGAVG
ncbi:MAG: hypothetical protein ILO68_01200 [Clostridia bacterium]|nr:hypothetical protein [Clostridia bacterium]